jgi:hypothetical protein
LIPIAKPEIGEEEIQRVTDVLRSGLLAQGEAVKEFEKAYAIKNKKEEQKEYLCHITLLKKTFGRKTIRHHSF